MRISLVTVWIGVGLFAACASDPKNEKTLPTAPLNLVVAAIPVVTTVTTIAGSGTATFMDGNGAGASFSGPQGVAFDAANNVLYVADNGNHRIRKMTTAGAVTTLAGSGTSMFMDGTGSGASFSGPEGVTVSPGGLIYVADTLNQRIRQVTTAGVVTTLAGMATPGSANGMGAMASFFYPGVIRMNPDGNVVIADTGNNKLRIMTPTGLVTTLAGSGTATYVDAAGVAACFNEPEGLGVDGAGNVYVADAQNQRIRKITPAGVVTTLAGSGTATFADGTGDAASFNFPWSTAVDSLGNVFVADSRNNRIRRVTPAGVVTTLAGSGTAAFADGVGTAASFNSPVDVVSDGANNLYVVDNQNHRIRKLATVGIGQLTVMWTVPSSAGSSPITGYTVTATAAGAAMQTCMTTDATSCTLNGLTTGVAYSVIVTATNSVGMSPAAPAGTATPN